LPQPDYLEFSLPASHVVLVTNDGSQLTLKVIAALGEKGNQVITLNLHGIDNPIIDNAITLSDNTDQAVANAIRIIK